MGISTKGMVAGDGVAFEPACDRLECRAERLASTQDKKIKDRKMNGRWMDIVVVHLLVIAVDGALRILYARPSP